jgi:hypothetical protein
MFQHNISTLKHLCQRGTSLNTPLLQQSGCSIGSYSRNHSEERSPHPLCGRSQKSHDKQFPLPYDMESTTPHVVLQ